MIDRLDVVAVGVEHKSGIVAGVITPLAGCALSRPPACIALE